MLLKSSRGEETLLFAKNFLHHPKMLGSLIPSSRFLIGRLLAKEGRAEMFEVSAETGVRPRKTLSATWPGPSLTRACM